MKRESKNLAVNKSGQILGQKGFGTRNRIVEATERLLAESRGVAPSVAALAREAGISAPTFYLYFVDAGEAILAVVERLEDRLAPVLELLGRPWPDNQLFDHSQAFVRAYFDYWIKHAPGLRARNRLADQGDNRFVVLRVAASESLVAGLAAKLRDDPVEGRLPCTGPGMAGVLMTGLERMATVMVLGLYEDEPRDIDDRLNALANLIALAIQG